MQLLFTRRKHHRFVYRSLRLICIYAAMGKGLHRQFKLFFLG